MNTPRVRLDEKDFEQLVRGKTIQLKDINGSVVGEVALADIGWDRMFFHVERAMRDASDGDLV